MDELEKLQLEVKSTNEKVILLEKAVEDSKLKIADSEKKVIDLEAEIKIKNDALKKHEDENAASLEKIAEDKADALLKAGNITPALKDNVKEVFLKGGVAAEMLEKSLKNQRAFSLEEKTVQDSKEVKKVEKLTEAEAEAEAERIKKGE